MHHRKNITDTKFLNLTATTTAPNQTITLTRLTVSKPSTIFWGDGTSETLPANSTSAVTHVYASAGTYGIKVKNARLITQIGLESATISGFDTAELRRSSVSYFRIVNVINSNIRTSDMVNWKPSLWQLFNISSGNIIISSEHMVNWPINYFYLTSITTGVFNVSSSHMTNWRPYNWQMYNLPATGTYNISSEHMVDWRPTVWYFMSMPSTGTYNISSTHFANWTPTEWFLYSISVGTYNISTSDFASWRPVNFCLYNLPASGTYTFSANCFRNWTGLRILLLSSLGLTQSVVDTILFDLYAGRMSYTSTSPSANLGGSNADPSGVYQAMVPPTTGMEAKYDLVNDPASEGFKKWSITT